MGTHEDTASRLLARLGRVVTEFGEGAAKAKLDLVGRLDRRRLPSARGVERFHEALCFLRAYPDSPPVLRAVEVALARFAKRGDLGRFRTTLADTGIAGTEISYSFFWPIARWLVERWPGSIEIDWSRVEDAERLAALLPLLVVPSEGEALDEIDFTPREWLARLAGERSTDATLFVRRLATVAAGDAVREELHDSLDLPYRLRPGADTPARTSAKYARSNVIFRRSPLVRERPDLRVAVRERPSVRALPPREGRVLLDMARAAMVTRSRDLYVFAHGDPDHVHLVDFGDGLQFAAIGFPPERRLLLHALFGFLTLQNGVPIGYVLTSSLFGMTGVAYNTFETYRGAEAGRVFGRVLALARRLFGTLRFTIDPYQLGYGNEEGQKSGAWWFYYKLGFRPQDPAVRRVLRRELAAMRRDPAHRSSLATLARLSEADVFLDLGSRASRARPEILPLWNVSLAVADLLTERAGAERERGLASCSRDAARLLGLRSLRGFTRGERLAWERWAPLVVALPRLRQWPRRDKRALVEVIRAKGALAELDFVSRFDAHTRLKRAVLRLAGC